MSRFRHRRTVGIGTLLATGVACLSASPALASPQISSGPATLDYVCETPLIAPGPRPGLVVTRSTFRSWPASGGFPISGSFTASLPEDLTAVLDTLGVADATVDGTWRWQVSGPGRPDYTEDATFTAGSIRQGGGVVTPTVSGTARPPAAELEVGDYALSLDALTLRVRGTDRSGSPVDLDTTDGLPASPLTITCSGPRSIIASINTITATQAPGLGAITVTDTTATVRFVGAPGTFSVSFALDGKEVKSVSVPDPGNPQGSVTFDGLAPSTTYTLTARGSAFNTGTSKPSAPVQFTTLPQAKRAVALSGPAAIVLRSPRLTGTAAGVSTVSGELIPATGAFTGTVALAPATASLKAFGAFPVKARLKFKAVGDSTGTTTASGDTLRTTQDVAISNVTLAGLTIATGTCHTATPPAITLSAPANTLTAGGTATASFALGTLTGCSSFGSLFGTTGGNVALALKLAPALAPTPAPSPAPAAS